MIYKRKNVLPAGFSSGEYDQKMEQNFSEKKTVISLNGQVENLPIQIYISANIAIIAFVS